MTRTPTPPHTEPTDLQLSCFVCDQSVDGDEENHDPHAGQHGRPQRLPQEVERHDDLEGAGPDGVEVGHQVHEALGVH